MHFIFSLNMQETEKDREERSCLTSEEDNAAKDNDTAEDNVLNVSNSYSPSSSYSSTTSSSSSSGQLCAANCCSPRKHENNLLPLVTICTAQHRMHVACAKMWLASARNNVSCPLCRDNAVFTTLAALSDEKEQDVRRQNAEQELRRSQTLLARIKRYTFVDCWLSVLIYLLGIAVIATGSWIMMTNFQNAETCYFDGTSNCPKVNVVCEGNVTGCEYDDAQLHFLYKINETSIRGSLKYKFDLCADRCCVKTLTLNEKLFCKLDVEKNTIVKDFFTVESSLQFISGLTSVCLGTVMLCLVLGYLVIRYHLRKRQLRASSY